MQNTRYSANGYSALLKFLVEYIKIICDESSNSSSPTPAKRMSDDESISTSPLTSKVHDSFWHYFDKVANENLNKCQEKNAVAHEIDYYLKTVRINRSCVH